MQMSYRPVQWLAVMLFVVFTAGQCQQNERWGDALFHYWLNSEGLYWRRTGLTDASCYLLPAVAELWLNTSWCTTVAETSRVSRDSSGCPAPSRVSTPPRLSLLLSTPQRSWTWLLIRRWSLLLGALSPAGCRASWETSLIIPTWFNCQTESPNIRLIY